MRRTQLTIPDNLFNKVKHSNVHPGQWGSGPGFSN